MNCTNCGKELPENAKFCAECGARVEKSNTCPNCGEALKPEARFCHNCGEALQVYEQKPTAAQETGESKTKQSWLHSFGVFLLIPIFAGIIVLLFWVNKEPEPVNASNPTNGGDQSTPSMASMQQVHDMLERLKARVAADSTDMVAIDSLAMMYSIAGSHDKARQYYDMQRKYYEQRLQTEPENNSIRVELAKVYYGLQRTQDAINLLEEVLDDEPTHAFALFYLGSIHAALGHKEMATESWQKIIDNYPGTEFAQMAQQGIHELSHVDNP